MEKRMNEENIQTVGNLPDFQYSDVIPEDSTKIYREYKTKCASGREIVPKAILVIERGGVKIYLRRSQCANFY
jgi:hypothetical protein